MHVWSKPQTFVLAQSYQTCCSLVLLVGLSCMLSFFFFFLNTPAPPKFSPFPLPAALPFSHAAASLARCGGGFGASEMLLLLGVLTRAVAAAFGPGRVYTLASAGMASLALGRV